jgi:hypothetical protein
MIFRFPLKDVTIIITHQKRIINFPLYSDNWHQINQNEFTLEVEGVAQYYASNGNYIEICPCEAYHQSTLELYLNGSVYGAILLQRMILPLHGSCFIYNGNGSMICGESGAGKSSLTAAFCLNGGQFLTDDISPVSIKGGKPYILTLSDRIKLWDDTLVQLNIQKEGLEKIDGETEKFYFPIDGGKLDLFLLCRIFILETHNSPDMEFQEIKGAEKLTSIRNHIYRLEYLSGMPQVEYIFFQNLVDISNNVTIIRVKRPPKISIHKVMSLLKKYMA